MSIIGQGQITWEEDENTIKTHSFVIDSHQTFEDIAAIIYERSKDINHTKVELEFDPDWVVDVSQ